MTRPTTAQFAAFTRTLRESRRPLLVSHTKPDGDALGSLAATRAMLRQLGVAATALLYEELPARYSLFDPRSFLLFRKGTDAGILAPYDSVVVLDTCAYNQMEPIADWLRKSNVAKFAVDHHVTRDDLANQHLIDESAAANCLILYDWAKALGTDCVIDRELAEALLIGIATDTGWFRHSNTDQRALAAAADLAGRGADVHRLFENLYLRDTEGRVRLLAAAIESLQMHAGGQLAVMGLSEHDFRRATATRSDTEDIINEPLRIGTVVVSVLLVEDNGIVRVSLRSRTPDQGVPDVDVAAVAQSLGGGGHSRAAGARVPGTLDAACERVLAAIIPRLAGR